MDLGDRIVAKTGAIPAMRNVQVGSHAPSVLLRGTTRADFTGSQTRCNRRKTPLVALAFGVPLSAPGSAVAEVAGLVRGELHVAVSADESKVCDAIVRGVAVDVIDDQRDGFAAPLIDATDRAAVFPRATEVLAGGMGRWQHATRQDAGVVRGALVVVAAPQRTEAGIGRDCCAVCTGLGGEAARAAVTGDAAVIRPCGTRATAKARIARLG